MGILGGNVRAVLVWYGSGGPDYCGTNKRQDINGSEDDDDKAYRITKATRPEETQPADN